jgi:hypothetical protein
VVALKTGARRLLSGISRRDKREFVQILRLVEIASKDGVAAAAGTPSSRSPRPGSSGSGPGPTWPPLTA